MIDRDRLLHAPVMAVLGRPAEYTPPGGGDPVPCTVRFREGDRDVPLFGAGVSAPARVARVRVAEVPDMAEGGTLTVDGVVHIIDKATRPDAARLLWQLELRS